VPHPKGPGGRELKQVLVQGGEIVVADVPAPVVEPGTVLVRVAYSAISTGTEMSGIQASGEPLWQRAIKRPDKVVKVAASVATRGLGPTRRMLESRIGAPQQTGYSASGEVIAVGPGIDDLRLGDLVACAGAGLANHAEVVRIPRNLVARIPEGVDLAEASTVTLGAIALQGVRRAQPTLGEIFVVVGLGLIGQLTVQLLRANGCRVIGTDLDRPRVDLAAELGMDLSLRDDAEGDEGVRRLTDGIGADGVIITAASSSSEVVNTAFRMCRRKGRVVVVGAVGLDLEREDLYQKEIDVLISTSYGPGRYDRRYEQDGLDYPVGYVRWTENRNMEEYLRLLQSGRVQLDRLIGSARPVDEAAAAYASLANPDQRPILALLSYPERPQPSQRAVANPRAVTPRQGAIRTALIGSGDFAKAVHLPNIASLSDHFSLRAVVSRSGTNAKATAEQYGAARFTTDIDEVLRDPEIDLVLIATRHDLHGSLVLSALEHGKHVFVEKPLALARAELEAISAFYSKGEAEQPILLTGFNRRFSPHTDRVRLAVADRRSPIVMTYRMNAGYLPLDHWTQGPQGGGRNLGEACHIYDLFTYITGSRVVEVQAQSIHAQPPYSPRDNFVATMRFEDGSVATLTYTALGARDFPKEHLEVYWDGRVATIDDYRSTSIHGTNVPGLTTARSEKGHREELQALAKAIQSGAAWPIPLWQQLQAMEIALDVEPYFVGNA
jgi:predicted dehydrogenase/threonine dehydrogenase-like Zn-dependent dehydrogenase